MYAFAISFPLRSVSLARILSFSIVPRSLFRLRSVPFCYVSASSSSLLSRFKHCLPFIIYNRPCFSPTMFSSLFDIVLALFKDKFDALSQTRARARVLPLFAFSPFDRSLSPPIPLSLLTPLTLYTHKDGHDDVTKHVTSV